MFISNMVDADAEATETLVWLDFACDSGYMPEESVANWSALPRKLAGC